MTQDLKTIWQKQETEHTPMPLEEIRKRAGRLHARVLWRNGREYIAIAVVLVWFGYYLWIFPQPLMRLGSAMIMAAALYVGWRLHRFAGTEALPSEASAAAWTDYYRSELVRQRDALGSVWKWYLGPFVPGLVVSLVGIALKAPPHSEMGIVAVVALCVVVFTAIWVLNRWGMRRLQRRIDELGG